MKLITAMTAVRLQPALPISRRRAMSGVLLSGALADEE